ncbi:MAG: hypothetical protein ACTS5I_13110 [Rhodanobacter sp.]
MLRICSRGHLFVDIGGWGRAWLPDGAKCGTINVAIYKMDWKGDPRVNLQKGEGGKAKGYQVTQLLKAIDKKMKGEELQ